MQGPKNIITVQQQSNIYWYTHRDTLLLFCTTCAELKLLRVKLAKQTFFSYGASSPHINSHYPPSMTTFCRYIKKREYLSCYDSLCVLSKTYRDPRDHIFLWMSYFYQQAFPRIMEPFLTQKITREDVCL